MAAPPVFYVDRDMYALADGNSQSIILLGCVGPMTLLSVPGTSRRLPCSSPSSSPCSCMDNLLVRLFYFGFILCKMLYSCTSSMVTTVAPICVSTSGEPPILLSARSLADEASLGACSGSNTGRFLLAYMGDCAPLFLPSPRPGEEPSSALSFLPLRRVYSSSPRDSIPS